MLFKNENLIGLQRWASLPLRLLVGFGFMAHGVAKLMRGPEHFAEILQKLGMPVPHLAAWGTILVELLGGFAVFIGAFVSLASVPMIVVLLAATFTVHLPYGFSSVKLKDVTAAGPVFGMPGYELNLLYIAALLMLAIAGPGPLAIGDVISALHRRTVRKPRASIVPSSAAQDARSGEFPAPSKRDATVNVRPADSGDAPQIARNFLESAESHAGFDERYATPEFEAISARYREGKQHLSAWKGEGITLVAEVHGQIAGFVDARLEKSTDPMHRDITYCYIADIGVSHEHRGKGIGTALMGVAERWGREHGAEFASLEYHAANISAGSFYARRLSYRVVSMFAIKPL